MSNPIILSPVEASTHKFHNHQHRHSELDSESRSSTKYLQNSRLSSQKKGAENKFSAPLKFRS